MLPKATIRPLQGTKGVCVKSFCALLPVVRKFVANLRYATDMQEITIQNGEMAPKDFFRTLSDCSGTHPEQLRTFSEMCGAFDFNYVSIF